MVSKPLRDGHQLTPRTSHRLIYPSRGRRGRQSHRLGRPILTQPLLPSEARIRIVRLGATRTPTTWGRPALRLLPATRTLTATDTATLAVLRKTCDEADHLLQAAPGCTSRPIASTPMHAGESSNSLLTDDHQAVFRFSDNHVTIPVVLCPYALSLTIHPSRLLLCCGLL